DQQSTVEPGPERYRLDPTTAYPWVKRGYCPRPPIPEAAAAVLSEQLGYRVTAAQLWPGRDGLLDAAHTGAADDLDRLTCVDVLLRELTDLTTTATASGGRYVGASGADLTIAVLDQLRGAVLLARRHSEREYVPPSATIPPTLPGARRTYHYLVCTNTSASYVIMRQQAGVLGGTAKNLGQLSSSSMPRRKRSVLASSSITGSRLSSGRSAASRSHRASTVPTQSH